MTLQKCFLISVKCKETRMRASCLFTITASLILPDKHDCWCAAFSGTSSKSLWGNAKKLIDQVNTEPKCANTWKPPGEFRQRCPKPRRRITILVSLRWFTCNWWRVWVSIINEDHDTIEREWWQEMEPHFIPDYQELIFELSNNLVDY